MKHKYQNTLIAIAGVFPMQIPRLVGQRSITTRPVLCALLKIKTVKTKSKPFHNKLTFYDMFSI